MDTYFIEFLEQLKQNLALKKPGEWAQKLMMPEGRIISPPHNKQPVPSAVLIALYEKNKEIFFPVIRRPVYNGHHSGQIGFPGGKFETIDINLTNTAIREAHEEIGININELVVIGSLSDLYIPITNMHVTPILGYLKTPPNYISDSFEVDEIFNINVNDLLLQSNKVNEKWNLRGSEVNVPFYYIQQQKIWGATAMILSELEQVLIQGQHTNNII